MRIGRSIIRWNWADILITPNKSLEYELKLGKDSNFGIFDFQFEISHKCDHAGITFIFGIYRLFWLNLNLYDHRHWNHKEDRWLRSGEVEEDDEEETDNV